MSTTKVECKCISKEEMINYDPANPISTRIKLSVPYDQKSIYWQLSGGTAIELITINQDAADMFVVGLPYEILISPKEIPDGPGL